MYEFLYYFKSRRREKYIRRGVDIAVYPLGAFGIIMSIPQISEVWIKHNAEGISPISWFAWSFISFFWICYGFIHKDKAITIINTLWFLVNFTVAVGALIYGQ